MRIEHAVEALHQVAAAHGTLRLLLLYGSRARGDAHHASDWDVGYLADSEIDHLGLLHEITSALRTDAVDLTDLERASGLLRFRAASEGTVAFEGSPGVHDAFALAAALHWYDVQPIVQQAHDDVLTRMP